MNRRGFLLSMLATGSTFAIARSGVLMPVRQLVVPSRLHEADEIGVITIDAPWYATGEYLDRWARMYGIQRQWFPVAEVDTALRDRVIFKIHQAMADAAQIPLRYLRGG